MRILLTAKHAPEGRRPIGGVQTWCRTVAKELKRRGHEVVMWGPEQAPPLGGFDFGVIANPGDTKRAYDWCQKAVTICHGLIPAENPRSAEKIAFTSEELRDHWQLPGTILRQPIDLEFWSPFTTTKVHLTRFSYRSGLRFIERIAKQYNLHYCHVRNQPPESVRRILHKSIIVFATGRAALEAMACDIPTVICDHRSSYQPPLMDLDLDHAMTRNYSGRGGIEPTPSNVREALENATSKTGWREHVAAHHDVRDIVDQLLEMY